MNLLVNGDFQAGNLSGWSSNSGPSNPVISTAGRPVGAGPPYYCAEIVGYVSLFYQTPAVPSTSTTYYASFWVKRATGTAVVSTDIIIQGAPPAGFPVTTYVFVSVAAPLPDVWYFYSTTFVKNSVDTLLVYGFQNADTGYFVDDAWLGTGPVCYPADTMILTRDSSGVEKEIRAEDIRPGMYVVNANREAVLVHKNVISGPVKRFYQFPSVDSGSEPLRLTGGHRLFHEGEDIKASAHPDGKRVKAIEQMVYTLICEKNERIYANGRLISAFGMEDWGKIENKVNHRELGHCTD